MGARVHGWGVLLLVVLLAPLAAGRARANDDDLVIIEDEPVTGKDGVIIFDKGDGQGLGRALDDKGGGDDDDDLIIIIDEPDAPLPTAERASGPLGRTWEAWHIAADTEIFAAGQLTDAVDGPWRVLGSTWVESWLLPAQNLSFYGTAFGRVAVDGTPEARVVPFADIYELYAKVTVERATVNFGRLVIPWGRTQAAGFGDRLHPPDLRRGPPFPDPARQKQPQLGAQVKGSLDVVGVEGVAFVSYEPTEGSLVAANQGGVRIGRYQTALARAPSKAGGLLLDDDTSALRKLPALAEPLLAARAWRRVGEIDVTASVAWQFDETPTLNLAPDVRRAIVAEALALRGVVVVPAPQSPCGGDVSLSCVGDRSALTYNRTQSFSLDASWGLGLVVVRAEAMAFPKIGDQGGKTALIVDDDGLRSVQVGQWSAAVAVEGQLGPAIDGSLELFNVAWDGVPRDTRLWGIEVLNDDVDGADTPDLRVVNRLAAGAHLGGAFFEDRVLWKVRGEAGMLQPDVLLSAEVRYRLPLFDLYVGGRGDLFTGFPGSPGWMRQDASLFGVFLGEGA